MAEIKKRPIIYICSRLKGNMEMNIIKANIYCREAYKMGYVPLAPHCIFTQFLDDRSKTERVDGMTMGLLLLHKCRELWVVSDAALTEHSYSEGMKKEVAYAKKLGKVIRYFNEDMTELMTGTGCDG